MNHSLILMLVGFNANLQLAHWQADTSLNTHKALGDLYEKMVGLTDELAEVCMGKQSSRDFPPYSIAITPGVSLSGLMELGLSIVSDIRSQLKQGADDDLLNIAADMSSEINRTKYLLKL